jgi:membrane-associated phospholipid phosphatase
VTHARRHPEYLLVALWVAALTVAFSLDRRVATWVRDSVPVNKEDHRTHLILTSLKAPGYFPVTLGIAAILAIFHRRHLQAALALLLSAIVVGTLYQVLKWSAGRHRPVKGIDPSAFHPFPRGMVGLWREQALSFPSGHASLSFASAMCLTMLLPRLGWLFFVIAGATAVERVIENAHYVSDVVAGAGLGILVGWLVTRAIVTDASHQTTTK